MLLRVIKVYKVKIKEVSHIPTKKDPNIVVTHLHVDLLNEQTSEQLAVTHYQISPTMNSASLYDLFKVPTDLPLDAFAGREGYAEVLEMLQLNNTVTRNIKRFISEDEYKQRLHLNNQPSPVPVSEEELAKLKKETLEKIEQDKISKEKRKEEVNKPKSTKPKKKASRKAVKSFSNLMQKQRNNLNKKPSFRGNLIDGYVEKAYPQAFERLLANHNKFHTKAGAIGSYLIVKARQECEHKNGISIRNFK